MIYDYDIKQRNNEEILYLYLDINQEFAKLNARKKKKKLDKTIKEYIRKNKIMFKGTTIVILVGGLVVGTLTLKEPSREVKNTTSVFPTYAISTLLKEEEEKENGLEKQGVEEEKQEKQKEEKAMKKETSKQVKKSTTKASSSKSSSSNTNKVTSSEKTETPEFEEQKTYVTIYRSNGSVLNLELEEYVIGVVGAEMPASFHTEALKAQAILARTYALKSLETGLRLTDNSSTQNYKSNEELKKVWGSSYSTYYNKIKKAVEETKGMYLTYNGEIIDAVYHSTSNGVTEDAKNVWENSVPYLVSVASPYDSTSSTFTSEKTISYKELSSKLGFIITLDTSFEIQSKTEGNRVLDIQIGTQVYNGVTLRNLLGLRSATFEVVKKENGVTFITKGFGHGVGMSQYGANGMAKNGSSYSSILKHYYQGVTLSHK